MQITYDPISEGAKELLRAGKDVRLYCWHNVAPGTPGAAVMMLVRRGLWVEKQRHFADDPLGNYSVYGPAQGIVTEGGDAPAAPVSEAN
jgi:hypothetical protein